MKLSFTTLACPTWTLDKVVAAAVENQYDAIDFRGYLDKVEVIDSDAFKGDSLREMVSRIQDAGLAVSCLSSSIHMSTKNAEDRAKQMDALKRYAELCQPFSCDQIRIFGGAIDGIADPVANAAETLHAVSAIAKDAGVRVVVETHDAWTDSGFLRKAFTAAGFPESVGFLWDVHHPYRVNGEKPETSAANLHECIWNTHWKDSYPIANPNDPSAHQLCLMGEGDVPLKGIYDALQAFHYDSWYTLEWEKRWHKDIAEPEVAIPQFAQFMRALAAK